MHRVGRALDLALALVLAAFALVLLLLAAYDRLPDSGVQQPVDIDSLTLTQFLQLSSIDLNQATQEELMTIYGIGEALSRNIIQHREQEGPYASAEALLGVPGIGEKRLELMRKFVYAG